VHFRMLLGDFEGIDSERGTWRCSDALGFAASAASRCPSFRRITPPSRARGAQSTWIRTRRSSPFMLEQLAEHDLLKGKTIGFDAMTLEANAAAMKESGRRYAVRATKASSRISRRRRASRRRRRRTGASRHQGKSVRSRRSKPLHLPVASELLGDRGFPEDRRTGTRTLWNRALDPESPTDSATAEAAARRS
jgi:hypothetical protein